MAAKEVVLETISWNSNKVFIGALEIIDLCRAHLPWVDPYLWKKIKPKIYGAVNDKNGVSYEFSRQVEFPAVGYSLIFLGTHQLPVPYMEDGDVVFRQPEPRFEFIDNTYLKMSPKYRNTLYKLSEQIAEEVQDVYSVKVRKFPLSLVFPQGEYALGSERTRAKLLS